MTTEWRPTCTLSALLARAALLREIREFFRQRDVLEVDTPLLATTTATDPHLHSLSLDVDGRRHYLQTSPEFSMKRLLAAGSGPVYQLGKVFRADESGRLHNREFTLLEWYRPGLNEYGLMDEVEALVMATLAPAGMDAAVRRITYRSLFREQLGLDPLSAPVDALQRLAGGRLDTGGLDLDRDGWLQLLFSHLIEPALDGLVFVEQFPASQAALAQLTTDAEGDMVARRFELYVNGVELANGYHELGDCDEQRRRFEQDNATRHRSGSDAVPVDERLLAALEHGLPDCAGVALGVDRLLMLRCGARHIDEVLPFPAGHA
ncbi:MAG: EF-P lysine aminoacylase EpmA [Pseudohongiellaceae bacterium]